MSQPGTRGLLGAHVLELTFTRSSAGQAPEVTDGTGKPLATAGDEVGGPARALVVAAAVRFQALAAATQNATQDRH